MVGAPACSPIGMTSGNVVGIRIRRITVLGLEVWSLSKAERFRSLKEASDGQPERGRGI